MNPYDFVPVNFNQYPTKEPPVTHEKFDGECVSGKLTGKITALTPIFLKNGNTDQFIKDKSGRPIIPGTSLKGMFRSVLETFANGCFEKFGRNYTDKVRGRIKYDLPRQFRACNKADRLCIACRIFGMLNGGERFTGKIEFQDAICTNAISHGTVNTIALMGPKPHHTAFYKNGGQIAGRKFYFHQPTGIQSEQKKTGYNQRINPLNTSSEFSFNVDFTNLKANDEWPALLYAIVLEDSMRHKIGYAKPSGFGSVQIEIEHIRLIDYSRRYTTPDRGVSEYIGNPLKQYIDGIIRPYTQNTTSQTLNALRRIWKWNPADTTQYQYPDTDWFSNNPQSPISQTP